jgi:cardiolipin synthase
MLNYEVNTVIYDKEVTEELDRSFESDIEESILITDEYFDRMPIHLRLVQSLARVISYLL